MTHMTNTIARQREDAERELSAARAELASLGSSGANMLDGTPVLDIKSA